MATSVDHMLTDIRSGEGGGGGPSLERGHSVDYVLTGVRSGEGGHP